MKGETNANFLENPVWSNSGPFNAGVKDESSSLEGVKPALGASSDLYCSEGGHHRKFSGKVFGKPNVEAKDPPQHDPFGNAKLCNDKWVLRKYGKPMLMTAGGYMVDPREYASRCAKPVASGSGSVPGSDSGTAGPDSDNGLEALCLVLALFSVLASSALGKRCSWRRHLLVATI